MPAWSPWQEGDKEVLEKVQKRAVKIISGLEGKTYEERLKEVGLLTLEERAPPGRHGANLQDSDRKGHGTERDMVPVSDSDRQGHPQCR